MKLNKYIIGGFSAMVAMAGLSACDDEKNTLSGADAVYIEMTPTNPSLCAGDTMNVSAVVTNVSGKVIDTPVKWTTDDESIVKVITIRTAKPVKGSRADADESGEGEGETGGEDPIVPSEPTVVDSVITYRTAIVAMPEAQGKSTKLRATLENGENAMTVVSVVSRTLDKNGLAPYVEAKRSYQLESGDTVWFAVANMGVLSECTPTYEFKIKEIYHSDPSRPEREHRFNAVSEIPEENFVIDEENSRIGVLFTAPRICGKAECTLTLTNREGTSIKATAPMVIYPEISPGFEVNGKRPGYSYENPSNIKQTLLNESMNINSTYLVGVCLGVPMKGMDLDVLCASAAEDNGLMYWEIEGSAVVVEDAFYDYKYDCPSPTEEIGMGYVTYLKVRSGSREGLTTIRYVMGDKTLVCNLTVENYSKTHPVDDLYVSNGDVVNPVKYDESVFYLSEGASIYVQVEPASSFKYHGVTITSSDNSIIEPMEHLESEANGYRFTTKKVGEAVLTITCLDKTITHPVKVLDKVTALRLPDGTTNSMMNGGTLEIRADVRMASGAAISSPVKWSTSDPSIATVESKPGDYYTCVITAHNPGKFKLYAEYDGLKTEGHEIEVVAVADLHGSDYSDENRTIGEYDGIFYLVLIDDATGNEHLYFEFDGAADFNGTFTGFSPYTTLMGEEYEGECEYNITLSDNGDGTVTVTGWLKAPTGATVYFDGLPYMIE